MSDAVFDCYEGEPVACYSFDVIVARKTHRCDECRHPIVPGEKYHRTKYKWEGEWWIERRCVCCEAKRCAVAEAFGEGYGGMCIVPGMLQEAIKDGIDEGLLTTEMLEAAITRAVADA